jgi:hypothetical protein
MEIKDRIKRLNKRLARYIPPRETWTPGEEALYKPGPLQRAPGGCAGDAAEGDQAYVYASLRAESILPTVLGPRSGRRALGIGCAGPSRWSLKNWHEGARQARSASGVGHGGHHQDHAEVLSDESATAFFEGINT